MSTDRTANIYIQNNTGGDAYIQMSHRFSENKPEVGNWYVNKGQKAGPLPVAFKTGSAGRDYWYCSASVVNGPNPGIYATTEVTSSDMDAVSTLLYPRKECFLRHKDATDLTFAVDTHTFHINTNSSPCSTTMVNVGPYQEITNIFVLMLENRSFDHLFGMMGNEDVEGLQGNEFNTYDGTNYWVKQPAVDPLALGPGHEFLNTMTQLCGDGKTQLLPLGKYPSISNSGFVADYAEEGADPNHFGDVMTVCDPEKQIPNLYKLALNFAVCDQWYSSLPGPTWPNRFFAMGATSNGLDDSPTQNQMGKWETVDGIKFANGSIFDHLKANGYRWRIYMDESNQFSKMPGHASGQFPIAMALNNIKYTDVTPYSSFWHDLQGQYPYLFTWIEPNYGHAKKDFAEGSSQHPTDSLMAGDNMIGDVYDAIRTSPYWASSVLIITYDEHGGYYDHVCPPAAQPPNDVPSPNLSVHGFNFAQFGVRVPAVIVSPMTMRGDVDPARRDHSSIIKLVNTVADLDPLTERDWAAVDFTDVLFMGDLRTNTPIVVSRPSVSPKSVGVTVPAETEEVSAAAESATVERPEIPDSTPLPESGNIIGFLQIALKTEIEMSGGTDAEKQAIIDNFMATVHTYGDANAYFERIRAAIEQRRAAIAAAQAAAPAIPSPETA